MVDTGRSPATMTQWQSLENPPFFMLRWCCGRHWTQSSYYDSVAKFGKSAVFYAQVVKLVDTLASGASARKGVEVQVLFWAPEYKKAEPKVRLFCACSISYSTSWIIKDLLKCCLLSSWYTNWYTKTSAMHSYIQCRKDTYCVFRPNLNTHSR